MNRKVFLTGEWNDLLMANYKVTPEILTEFLPYKTELDYFEGDCYVSLVAFVFNNVRIKGFKIPFHVNFPEVNLRFYVRYRSGETWKRGVVFVRELVPRAAIALVANTLYKERYASAPMRLTHELSAEQNKIRHRWKWKGKWNSFAASSLRSTIPIDNRSQEDFITDHYWGYSSVGEKTTNEYAVEHPRWELHPLIDSKIDCDFGSLYGSKFEELNGRKPDSVFHAAGSAVLIREKVVIR